MGAGSQHTNPRKKTEEEEEVGTAGGKGHLQRLSTAAPQQEAAPYLQVKGRSAGGGALPAESGAALWIGWGWGWQYPFKCLHHPIIHAHIHKPDSISLFGEHLSRDADNIRQNPSQSLTNMNLSKNKKIKKNHLP